LGFISTLKASLEEGKVTQRQIDLACRRVLEAKYKLGLFEDPYRYLDEERSVGDVLTAGNLLAARETAARSMVLLKNEDQLLPLKKTGKIAVVGPLADNKTDMLGTWVTVRDQNSIVTVREGLKKVGGESLEVVYAKGANITDDPYMAKELSSPFAAYMGGVMETETRSPEELLEEALEVSSDAEVIVAVLGESAAMSGEASSRANIGIPESQRDLLKALLETGKPVVLVLINGRPLTLTWENEHVPAILEAWAPGTEAGDAIADVLFGDYNPAGKLTMSFPRSVGQIPVYYNHLNTGRPFDANNKFTSKYLDLPNDPLFPFGYGLSYTTFGYSDITLSKSSLQGNEILHATVTLTNTGDRPGEEVVQLYLADPVATISRPVKELKNFRKVTLQPGEQQEVSFEIGTGDLKFYNNELVYDWEPGTFKVFIGTSSDDVKEAEFVWEK
jgi:beta-glucosidase